MPRKLGVIAIAVVVTSLAVLGAAAARTSATPGVTSKSILLGGSGPLTGEAAAAGGVLRGADAYFKYVNGRGGVNGRKINFKYLDDAYDPALAVQNARQLIQQDQVFALFSTVGTNNNLAIRPFANASKVPHLFLASGATTFGRDYKRLPVHDRLPAELLRGGPGLRAVHAGDEAGRSRRSPSSTRTTTTARTCSPASSRARREQGQARREDVLRADRHRRAVPDRRS